MRLHHTMLRVTDLEASLAFYTGFLGLEELRRHELGDEATLVFLSDAERKFSLELTFNKDGRSYELGNQFGHIALLVDDLDAVLQTVKSKAWPFRESKPPGRYLFVKDPDGYDIEILQAGK